MTFSGLCWHVLDLSTASGCQLLNRFTTLESRFRHEKHFYSPWFGLVLKSDKLVTQLSSLIYCGLPNATIANLNFSHSFSGTANFFWIRSTSENRLTLLIYTLLDNGSRELVHKADSIHNKHSLKVTFDSFLSFHLFCMF